MRKGTKTITTEVSGYFADDGTFFIEEEKCRDYEAEQFKRKLFNITFDVNLEKPRYVDDMTYFIPKNQKDIEMFIFVREYYNCIADGITLDSPLTIYKYDYEREEYIDIIQYCKELIAEINFLVPDTFSETT